MSIMNIVMLSIGTIIIVSALSIMLTSVILETVLNVKKEKNKTLIPTEIEGEYKIQYNVSSKLTRITDSFLDYKAVSIIGLLLGVACVSLPLIQMLVTTLPIPPK